MPFLRCTCMLIVYLLAPPPHTHPDCLLHVDDTSVLFRKTCFFCCFRYYCRHVTCICQISIVPPVVTMFVSWIEQTFNNSVIMSMLQILITKIPVSQTISSCFNFDQNACFLNHQVFLISIPKLYGVDSQNNWLKKWYRLTKGN